ncbi:XTP/dITP diphosphatase [Paenibacillus sp. N1-5-1-14]|uniref:XTP/dITP diphosphatase n=1 Tax=Paenibacillus radicibacter TaxID=2972488 RepID=UPI002158BB6A|nr:XTP/dITP diphosphatase [Paenibacillus radicibacter]MCR8644202.1 XTP/dITP diphosphatase [Paenibacillus radicibacter]
MNEAQKRVVVIATANKGKVQEFANWFGARGMEVRSLADYDNLPEIVEDGDTFAANARIKAELIANHLGMPVLADDSGLSVDRLNGEPGVYSARYAGVPSSDANNNAKLLRELALLNPASTASSQEDPSLVMLSSAHFVSALALAFPESSTVLEAEGRCSGYIVSEPRGTGGFGYDPLFYLPEFDKTMAELTLEEKNKISHRAHALELFFKQYPDPFGI